MNKMPTTLKQKIAIFDSMIADPKYYHPALVRRKAALVIQLKSKNARSR